MEAWPQADDGFGFQGLRARLVGGPRDGETVAVRGLIFPAAMKQSETAPWYRLSHTEPAAVFGEECVGVYVVEGGA